MLGCLGSVCTALTLHFHTLDIHIIAIITIFHRFSNWDNGLLHSAICVFCVQHVSSCDHVIRVMIVIIVLPTRKLCRLLGLKINVSNM